MPEGAGTLFDSAPPSVYSARRRITVQPIHRLGNPCGTASPIRTVCLGRSVNRSTIAEDARTRPVMRETTMNTKLRIFMAVVIAHWAEHLFQVYQIYALGWAPHMAGGMLGYVFPWLVHSEVLH